MEEDWFRQHFFPQPVLPFPDLTQSICVNFPYANHPELCPAVTSTPRVFRAYRLLQLPTGIDPQQQPHTYTLYTGLQQQRYTASHSSLLLIQHKSQLLLSTLKLQYAIAIILRLIVAGHQKLFFSDTYVLVLIPQLHLLLHCKLQSLNLPLCLAAGIMGRILLCTFPPDNELKFGRDQ